jgi:hypothetical protein
MLATQTLTRLTFRVPDQTSDHSGLSRLFAAAVVSRQFRDELLNQPKSALTVGYLGETFSLTDREQALIVSIHAESLPDLARQVNRALGSRY